MMVWPDLTSNHAGTLLRDFFEFNPIKIEWQERTSSISGQLPPGREGHSQAALGGRLFIFGGWQSQGDGWEVEKQVCCLS
jgi:hypothetical protein